MAIYKVGVTEHVTYLVTVEADTEDEASALAIAKVIEDDQTDFVAITDRYPTTIEPL